jgi:hypothetical protein
MLKWFSIVLKISIEYGVYMTVQIIPNHVAILVPSVRKAANFLSQFHFKIGNEEVWEGEGTKEIYVESDMGNSLLLMEPIKDGAYQRALVKRGPGIHHMAIDVLNIEDFIDLLVGSGWLLHPTSIKTLTKTRTVFLARPGFPGLIEVQERKELIELPLFVNSISILLTPNLQGLLKHVGLDKIVKPSLSEVALSLNDKCVRIRDLL